MTRNAPTETNLEPHRRDGRQDRAGAGGGLGGSAAPVAGTCPVWSCQLSAWRRLTLPGATRSNFFNTSSPHLSCHNKANKCKATSSRILLTGAPASAVIRAQENRNQLTPDADAACRGLILTGFGIMRLAHDFSGRGANRQQPVPSFLHFPSPMVFLNQSKNKQLPKPLHKYEYG
jgi:hypothetical protein